MNGVIGLAVIVLVLCCLFSGRTTGRRATPGNIHGGSRHTRARHEAGHAVAAKALGARVTSINIDNGAGGVSWTGSKAKTPEGIASDVITFMAAGRLAAGSRRGCSGDEAAIREQLRYVPRGDRARVRRQAEAHAARIVSSRKSDINKIAKGLL